MTVPQALQIALQHHHAGRLAEAEALYRQILAVQPHHAGTLRLLGIIALQSSRHDLAAQWTRQSIAVEPNFPPAHCILGEACHAMGRLDEAIAAYRRALQLKPDLPEACNNLGNALREQGKFEEATAAFRQALQLQPDLPEAHNNLGIILGAQGRVDEAIAAYRRALELEPHFAKAHNNLGSALRDSGQLDEAIAACRRALEFKPGYSEAHYNLGAALAGQGRLDEAIAEYQRAIQLKPDCVEAWNNLGAALRESGRLDEAIAAHRQALHLKPDFPETLNNLGIALKERGELDEAIAAFRQAIQLRPNSPEAFSNLGNVLRDCGELDEAIAAHRHALQIKPGHPGMHSNLVFALHFHAGHDSKSISEEHERWNLQFGDPLKQFVRPQARDRNPKRPLRIGYVSPDFRDHAVGRFLLPLFELHDRVQFEMLCYSGVTRPDWMTERFQALATIWRSTIGVSDARMAELIRKDSVDILVDLALHTAGNRLPVFALQPAPVQVTWLAYAGSTGLPSIGYRLTDAHMDPSKSPTPRHQEEPQGEAASCRPCNTAIGATPPSEEKPAWSAEEPIRLPDCWCCYCPMDDSPPVNPLPALSAGCVTFGSLNSFAKVNQRVLTLWARILQAVKRSRLLMLCPEGQPRARVHAFFTARGIAIERVEWAGFLPHLEYLKLYHRIDLGLDPFPYNGMTTTCDALWMGVPVLTLPGEMPASRAGLSLLSNVGLRAFAAQSEEDYIRLATMQATDLPALARLRANLRSQMQASPLMDAPRFVRNIEAAYRSMWRRWRAAQE